MQQPRPRQPDDDELLVPLYGAGDRWLELVQAAERPVERRTIGDYEILDEVRSGGQALVFRARHMRSGREVALKRMAHGAFASTAERRRFEREVAATTGLQHPGIVTVYGTEEVAGVELLVMEWVRGVPLDEWARALSGEGAGGVRDKLAMFLQVCEAVQHAHQNGVIHRDLKPSNVLVDDAGRCRVLDFGMARRIAVGDDERTIETLTGGFAGTPAYAPPEAGEVGGGLADTRGDVYSLGVMLYELLAGRRPFRGASLRELLEQIADREPARLQVGFAARQRDLDAIVRMALQKSPADRYATVHDLAADLRRYLEGHPVTALKPTAAYVLRRWIGRHRAAFAAACAATVLATGAVITIVVQSDRIAQERDVANLARKRADNARIEADGARREAVEEAANARAVADFYLDLVKDAAPSSPRETVDFFEVLHRASLQARERLAATPKWVAEIEANMALWLNRRGRFEEAIELAEHALALQRDTGSHVATTTCLLYRVIGESRANQGQWESATEALRAAVAAVVDLDQWRRTRSVVRYSLGRVLQQTEQFDEAARVLRAAIADADAASDRDVGIAGRAGLASVLLDLKRLDEAEEALRDATSLVDERVTREVRLTLCATEGGVHLAKGEPERAVEPFQRAVELAREVFVEHHPERALSHFRLARALRAAKREPETEAPLRRALELGLTEGELPLAREWLGFVLASRGDVDEAAELYELAWIEFDRQLMPAHGRRVVAFANWLGVLLRTEHTERAREQYPKLLAQIRSCARLGGCASPFYWERVFEMGKMLGFADEARAELRAALADLQAGPSAEHPQVVAIATTVATFE